MTNEISKFDFTFHVTRIRIESHQFHRFVIATRGNQIAGRTPAQAVNRSFVMFGSFEQNGRLLRCVIVAAIKKQKKQKKKPTH